MSLFPRLFDDWGNPIQPKHWLYWPIRIGWDSYDVPPGFISWYGWPADGPSIWREDAYLEYGWTVNIGPLKIHFGLINDKD